MTQKVKFSKFADLRPRECVLAGASGTHSVCVCSIHKNVELMLVGCRLDKITKGTDLELKDYNDCLKEIMCNPPEPACHLGTCEKCKSTEKFQESLENLLCDMEEVEFKQWETTDRTTLNTKIMETGEFVEKLCEKLAALRRHDYIAKKQNKFCSEMKKSLKDGQYLVICDFAENYSFITQDEIQSYHWNTDQATLHPFVAYYKEDEELKHTNLVVISDCLIHDTVAVHLFQRQLVDHLTQLSGKIPSKIIYFSDGAASQYKNFKNFLNLCYHKEDFSCEAEWHFFATSHGKGPCDGIGGTVKRLSARASLQRPYNDQIRTVGELYEFAKSNIPGITVTLCNQLEHQSEEKLLLDRFSLGKTVKGTQRLHGFLPISTSKLKAKDYSDSNEFREVLITEDDTSGELDIEQIKGFVTAVWNGQWYLACVLSTDPVLGDVKLSFLNPPGPAGSYSFPACADIGNVSASDILMVVDPMMTGRSGRTYKLTNKENEESTRKLKYRK